MSEPYYHPASINFRDLSGNFTGVAKPKTSPKLGKQYVMRNNCTLFHHFHATAWRLESQADDLQYSHGYLFEEVTFLRESAQGYKNMANKLMGINPIEWCKLFEGATCEI